VLTFPRRGKGIHFIVDVEDDGWGKRLLQTGESPIPRWRVRAGRRSDLILEQQRGRGSQRERERERRLIADVALRETERRRARAVDEGSARVLAGA
jgi:hypothetical protein